MLLFIEEIRAVHQNLINIIGACVLSIKKGARGKGRTHFQEAPQCCWSCRESHISIPALQHVQHRRLLC